MPNKKNGAAAAARERFNSEATAVMKETFSSERIASAVTKKLGDRNLPGDTVQRIASVSKQASKAIGPLLLEYIDFLSSGTDFARKGVQFSARMILPLYSAVFAALIKFLAWLVDNTKGTTTKLAVSAVRAVVMAVVGGAALSNPMYKRNIHPADAKTEARLIAAVLELPYYSYQYSSTLDPSGATIVGPMAPDAVSYGVSGDGNVILPQNIVAGLVFQARRQAAELDGLRLRVQHLERHRPHGR